ncbi:unnamed protein product [Didymodactylos carnosus]|uniref:Saccharopine dehydrogenase n=1 Tax=Didymodactylos carnosus TaxID=1234261 RepID=A0A814DNF8_9BILA|nr:unnamed protein product [Didymodactylos carnosus]CAF0957282.1 unnamed protein product [Didymodactylos carnosus]CAF3660740.1 unnamed protein product [Didymodactylos carnosus]CAF3732137.1 unnamed protein product [Didymodactylos carnosus]
MKRILILGGAGRMSSGTARDLLATYSHSIEKLIIADSSNERLDILRQSLTDSRIETHIIDVTDRQIILSLLAKCDVCINAVPTFAGLQMDIFHACFEAKRNYVDYGGMGIYTVQQKAEHDQWEKAGITAILGLGADPGLSNILCRVVADRLDKIDKINLYWAAKLIGDENPILIPPYNLSTVLAEYTNPSQQFLNGKLQQVPAQSGFETIDLPEPFGKTSFMHSQHSEPLTVPFANGIKEKGMQEFTWKLSLPEREHQAWIGLVKAGFGESFDEDVTLPNGTSVRPVDVLQAVIDRNIERHKKRIPDQELHEIHFAIGQGVKEGNSCRVTARMIGLPDPMYNEYVDACTSMSMSIGVQQFLNTETTRKSGVYAPEEYFNADKFLEEIRKRNFKVEIETQITEKD